MYFPLNKTGKELVLFESPDGETNHLFITRDGKEFRVRDDYGKVRPTSKDEHEDNTYETPSIKDTYMGWKHLMIIYRKGKLRISIDFQQIKTIEAQLSKPIKYIGNSKTEDKPFGLIADLRFYPHSDEVSDDDDDPDDENEEDLEGKIGLKVPMKRTIHDYWKRNLEPQDTATSVYKNLLIIAKLFKHARAERVHKEVVRCLANLCSNKLCRTDVLRYGGINLLINKAYTDAPDKEIASGLKDVSNESNSYPLIYR
ncbi:unnamed protein product [Moneuplotes crassus]|uniref:Uncharacterized protein n=1 Tax=Euplotes crassus TaxID=5936 RepID=A0AAD1XSL6_EUPCR|nr:unnamed protein product [Moneuplotes crassus]